METSASRYTIYKRADFTPIFVLWDKYEERQVMTGPLDAVEDEYFKLTGEIYD